MTQVIEKRRKAGPRVFGIPQLLKELRRMKYDLQRSYREADGAVRDPDALYSIDCLDAAIECVKESRNCGPWTSSRL